MKIDKFVVGIRTASKMFRIQSVGGVLLDNILALRNKGGLDEDYYTEISISADRFQYSLKNEKLGNMLHMDTDGIVFTKDCYEKVTKVDFEKFISEYSLIWDVINNSLKIEDIRRIGIASEHQISTKDNTCGKHMVDTFTKFKQPAHQGRFHLRFEDRRLTKEGLAPDIKKSDFLNVLYDYYDGESDVEHPNKNTLNANLDVQRYFSPLLKKGCFEETSKLLKIFESEKKTIQEKLKNMGVLKNA
jgi:hypothetical protein